MLLPGPRLKRELTPRARSRIHTSLLPGPRVGEVEGDPIAGRREDGVPIVAGISQRFELSPGAIPPDQPAAGLSRPIREDSVARHRKERQPDVVRRRSARPAARARPSSSGPSRRRAGRRASCRGRRGDSREARRSRASAPGQASSSRRSRSSRSSRRCPRASRRRRGRESACRREETPASRPTSPSSPRRASTATTFVPPAAGTR